MNVHDVQGSQRHRRFCLSLLQSHESSVQKLFGSMVPAQALTHVLDGRARSHRIRWKMYWLFCSLCPLLCHLLFLRLRKGEDLGESARTCLCVHLPSAYSCVCVAGCTQRIFLRVSCCGEAACQIVGSLCGRGSASQSGVDSSLETRTVTLFAPAASSFP